MEEEQKPPYVEEKQEPEYVFNHEGVLPRKGSPSNIVRPRPINVTLTQVDLFERQGLDPHYLEQFESLGERNKTQKNGIDKIRNSIKLVSFYDDDTSKKLDEMFDRPLDWAYRCYQVTPTSIPGKKAGYEKQIFQKYIYLFNILIAFEWEPNLRTLEVLERTAHRASDFLFNVTDGWMAIGQVVLGGPKLLHCADVQVMASTRLHPRSWVGGLHEPAKYMPIRMGRGMWQKNNRISIPWDEPEGYRALIHEWAHYALELLDAYTEPQTVYIPKDVKSTQSTYEARRGNRDLIVPTISQPVESIMSTLEGTSKLTAHHDVVSDQHKRVEWDTLIYGFDGLDGRKPRFPRIPERALDPIEQDTDPKPKQDTDPKPKTSIPAWQSSSQKPFEPLKGPLPIRELPHIRLIQAYDNAQVLPEFWLTDDAIRPDIEREHCWVYILRYEGDSIPERIIAQGTLDSQLQNGFPLLSAQAGDTIVLIGTDTNWNNKILSAKLDMTAQLHDAWDIAHANQPIKIIQKLDWHDHTPDPVPIIDVLPLKVTADSDQTAQVQVRVRNQDGRTTDEKAKVHVFPLHALSDTIGKDDTLDHPPHYDVSNNRPTDVAIALDGHVFVTWENVNKFVIVPFSQGGGPPTGSPTGNTPITPGSSEGNLMIFFANRDEYPHGNKHHSEIKVVTTRLVSPVLQVLDPDHTEARGYAFSLCSNAPLPLDYTPTIVLSYDNSTNIADGNLVIHRQDEQGYWQPMPSYAPDGAWYVAASLDRKSAPSFFLPDTGNMIERIERYRLCLKPLDSNAASGTHA